jgi:hypothetical protein
MLQPAYPPTRLAYASPELHPRTSRADEAFNDAMTRLEALQKCRVAVRERDLVVKLANDRDIHASRYCHHNMRNLFADNFKKLNQVNICTARQEQRVFFLISKRELQQQVCLSKGELQKVNQKLNACIHISNRRYSTPHSTK